MSYDLRLPLPEAGMKVPIFATFTGHKRVPFWAAATNSANPKLRFFNDEVELKVIRTHRRAWRDVELVDARSGGNFNCLTLKFRDTPWDFTATLILPRYLREALRFLELKELVLTPRARAIMESNAP